ARRRARHGARLMLLAYTIRNLRKRKASALPTLAAIAVTSGVTTAMLSFMEGLRSTMLSSGDPNNAIVLARSAQSESSSAVKLEAIQKIRVAPGVKKDGDIELVSPELLSE